MRLETDRLLLRDFEREDAGPVHYWHRDPEVMTYLGGVTHPELPEFQAFMDTIVAKYERYRAQELPWSALVVLERESWRPVGTGLLKPIPDVDGNDMDEIEIGWHLARHTWGRGYATEMGRALLDAAFTIARLDHINALVDENNHASARVCERLGMEERARMLCRYGEARRFVTTRAAWENR